MSSANPLWWWALALLLLPIWWHRDRRQRRHAELLATARFLPRATPQQQPIWAWVERLLLWLRCLLLIGVIAWLADVAWAWRGDTVLLTEGVDPAWAELQIQQAGFTQARRLSLPPAAAAEPLTWLAAHEREWRGEARLLLLGAGAAVAMPAQPPKLAHPLELRVQAAVIARTTVERHVLVASERAAQWRSLFKAFESAGQGRDRYVFDDAPGAQTELIVWDQPGAPDAAWRAPLWWAVEASAFPELNARTAHPDLQQASSARGRLWALARWPLQDLDGARVLFHRWQTWQRAPQPYAAPSTVLPARATTPALEPIGALQAGLAPLLVLLFALERGLAHARRR